MSNSTPQMNQNDAPTASASSSSTGAATPPASDSPEDPLIMYVVIRQDLDWPRGAIVSQGSHACCAAIAEGLRANDEHTQNYLRPENLPHLRKCVLGAADLKALEKLGTKLTSAPPSTCPFYMWLEQPENIATALASWPRPKSQIQKLFKGFKLFA
ncbi:unnamed protein product [Amoebophrya sp. A25]|nr:unnamed protein product [Amoebophrya sp. A25]|eukprot:GSA25T00024248001.1